MKSVRTVKILGSILMILVTLAAVGLYDRKAGEVRDQQFLREFERKNHLSRYLRFGQKFTLKSAVERKRLKGKAERAIYRDSFHIFNFSDMTVTQKIIEKGKKKWSTYVINDYKKKFTLSTKVHILTINSDGLKQILVCPKGIEYHYNTGEVRSFTDISREASVELLQVN